LFPAVLLDFFLLGIDFATSLAAGVDVHWKTGGAGMLTGFSRDGDTALE
jgi:hypothetical protein